MGEMGSISINSALLQTGGVAIVCVAFIWYLIRRDKEQTTRDKSTQSFFASLHQRDADAMTKLTGAITSLVVVINTLSSDVSNHDKWAREAASRIEGAMNPPTRPNRKAKSSGEPPP